MGEVSGSSPLWSTLDKYLACGIFILDCCIPATFSTTQTKVPHHEKTGSKHRASNHIPKVLRTSVLDDALHSG